MYKYSITFLLFLLFPSLLQGQDIIFESCEGYFSSSFEEEKSYDYEFENFSSSTQWQCRDRDNYVFALSGVAATLGSIGLVCAVAPEPAATKVTALVFTGSSTAVTMLSWLVSGIDCNDTLSESQKEQIRMEACKAMGLSLDKNTKQCI